MNLTERGLTMKLQIREVLIQIIQLVVLKVGLTEAVLLQQLHFRSQISLNKRDNHYWVYKTYEEWKNEESLFLSVDTNKRTIINLETKGCMVSGLIIIV